jgi:hypothetical protein
MGRLRAALGTSALLFVLASADSAHADDKCPTVPRAPAVTWGATPISAQPPAASVDDPIVARARELLARAKFLDEVATLDEKSAVDLVTRMPALKAAAKAARDKADRANGDAKQSLVAIAEHLETDVTVSEAEAMEKRRDAVDNRRIARELRARAVKMVRDGAAEEDSACDPPFRFTADGRKIYRLECLK